MQQEDDGLAAAQMELASLRAVMQIFGLKMAPSHTVLVYIFGSPVLSSCSEQAFINKQLQLLFSTMTSFSNAAKLRRAHSGGKEKRFSANLCHLRLEIYLCNKV